MLCRSFVGRIVALNRLIASNNSLHVSKHFSAVVALRNVERQMFTSISNCGLLNVRSATVCQQRFKAKRKGKESKNEQKEEEEEDEDDGDVSDVDELKLPETMKVDVPSLKIEFVLTRSLFKTRGQFDESISKQRLRCNGEPVGSKDMEVALGDVFDHVLGRNPENYDLLDVNRVTIMSLPDKLVKKRLILEVERTLRLTIPDYKNKWEGISLNNEEKR